MIVLLNIIVWGCKALLKAPLDRGCGSYIGVNQN